MAEQGSSLESQAASAAASKVQSEVKNAAVKKLASTAVGAAAKKAVSNLAASVATGGTSLAVNAAQTAWGMRKNIARVAGATIAFGLTLLSGGITSAASSLWSSVAIALVTVPAVVAMIVLMINTGAYVVPQGPEEINTADIDEVISASLECLTFTGPWPQRAITIEKEAALIILEDPKYSADLCRAGEIEIYYEPEQAHTSTGFAYGGEVIIRGKKVQIYEAGTGSLRNSLFTLSHELGHIYDNRIGMSSTMGNDPRVRAEWGRNYICTYPITSRNGAFESFAESVALYIAGSSAESTYRNFACMGGLTFRQKYPESWRFLRNRVFGTDLSW